MRARLLIYGLLTLFICLAATFYLVYTNQERILDAARYKLTSLAKDEWGVSLTVENSHLNLYRSAVVFRSVKLTADDESFSLAVPKLEMIYSLEKLVRGEILLSMVRIERPTVEIALSRNRDRTWPINDVLAFILTDLAAAASVELEKGTLSLRGAEAKEHFRVEGLLLRWSMKDGVMDLRGWLEKLKLEVGFAKGQFSNGAFQATMDRDGIAVKRFELGGEPGYLSGSALINTGGTLVAEMNATADLDKLRHWFEGPVVMTGSARGSGRFTLVNKEWSLNGRLETSALTLWSEPIPDVTAAFDLSDASCRFSEIAGGDGAAGSLGGIGELVWTRHSFDWNFHVQAENVSPVKVEYLRRHIKPAILNLASPVNGRVDFGGGGGAGRPWASYATMDLDGFLSDFFADNNVHVSGSLEFPYDGPTSLRKISCSAGTLSANLSGTVAGDGLLSVAVLLESSDLASTLKTFGYEAVGGTAGFAGDLSGTLDDPAISGGLTIQPAIIRGVSLERVWGRLEYKAGTVTVSEMTVADNGGRINLAGSLRLEDKSLAATAVLTGFEAADVLGVAGAKLPVKGAINGKVVLHGGLDDLSGLASLTASTMEVKGRRIGSSRVELSFGPDKVEIKSAEARYGGGRLSFEGEYRRRGTIDGVIKGDFPMLGELFNNRRLAGGLSFSASLSGPAADPEAAGTVVITRPEFGGTLYPDHRLKIAKTGGKLRAETDLWGRFPAVFQLNLDEPRRLTADVEFASLESGTVLAALSPCLDPELRRLIAPYDLTGWGTLAVSVPLGDPAGISGSARLTKLEAMVKGQKAELREPAEIFFTPRSLKVERLVVGGRTTRFAVSGGVSGGAVSLSLKGTTDLSFLTAAVPRLTQIDARPEINLLVTGSINAPRLTGSARIAGGEARLAGLNETIKELEALVEFEGNVAAVRRITGRIGSGSINGSGWFNTADNRMSLSIEGAVALASVDYTIPGVRDYSGSARFEATLRGPVARPSVDADVRISDGRVRLDALPSPFTEVNISASISDDYLRLREVTAAFNGGSLKAAGFIVLGAAGIPEDISLELAADKIIAAYADTVKSVLSAQVTLQRAADGYLLRGQIEVERGKYYKDMQARPAISFTGAGNGGWPAAVKGLTALKHLRLDLQLVSKSGFWIDNNVARVNAGLSLKLAGTLFEPVISGEARVLEGTIHYLGKRFKLEEAAVNFAGVYPPDPTLNIRARTVVSGVDILLVVQGALSSLNLELISDPPYSREDIVALLTLGAPRSLLENKGREVSALGAVMVFSGALIGKLEESARDFTGLEVFQIEPVVRESGGGARLVVGKQISDRIFLSYSRNLAYAGDDQFSLEYQLLDFLSLVGRQDRQGKYSFDLVFSFEGFKWPGR